MKRPPGLWILLSAGVLWLSLQDVYGIRATALIFGKSSTSTSTTELPADGVSPEITDEETATSTPASSDSNSDSTNNGNSTGNSTGHVLTGIPQIDYVWDPNLPKELNGFNLSDYPFYERVPNEVIEFKCDGLHDGFYASIPHKCQVYHQCLFGTRYDFLCANYTAFDQKTFICQFVSIVDCVNSKKFWHRNDALYQTQSTTTTAPINLKAAIYTTASPNGDDPIAPRRNQGGARRRPASRRRPQFEYYDDEYYDDEEYYEERPRANRGRKRPRPRPRPVYEDEEDYEEYDDERYESRRSNSRRRPSRRKNKDRKKPEYEEDDAEVEDKFEDEDYVPAPKRSRPEDRRKATDEDEGSTRKRPPSEKRRPSTEKREQSSERKPPRKSNRRPAHDDEEYEDELPQSDDSRSYEDRPRKKHNGQKEEDSVDGRPIIKPSTGTIYDRPRVAPRINLPVPKNAADKYAYTTKSLGGSTTTPKPEEEYEEYEEIVSKRPTNRDRRPVKESKKSKNEDAKSQPSGSRHRTRKPELEEEVVEKTTSSPKPKYAQRNRLRASTTTKKPAPVSQEYEDDDYLDEDAEERRPILKTERKTTTTTTSTSTTTTEAPRKEPVMRIIKRPFLPSRGGNPYSSRGLQPVGLKAIEKPAPEIDSEEYIDEEKDLDYAQDEEAKPEEKFKPSPVLIKVPVRPKYTEAQELIDLEPSRQQTYKARTTQRPKNPLDLNEYDVTLNDALNPTLPNLPVRAFPTGFSSGIDYTNGYQRTRYVMEPNQNFLYSNKVAKSPQRYEAVPQGQYSTLNAGYRQPQAQTQALYSGY